ncbi:MAG: hypothetical protein WA842_05845 [Croceibacterium sp.]
MTDTGNVSQARVVADQVAEAAILRFTQEHPELRQSKGKRANSGSLTDLLLHLCFLPPSCSRTSAWSLERAANSGLIEGRASRCKRDAPATGLIALQPQSDITSVCALQGACISQPADAALRKPPQTRVCAIFRIHDATSDLPAPPVMDERLTLTWCQGS